MPITINGDSGLSGVNGDAGTPALQGTDSNTGIVFGTDTVQVSTGGSARATVDSSGDVAIGVATATARLTVEDSSATKANFTHSSSNKTAFYIESDDASARIGSTYYGGGGSFKPLAFLTSGTERMRITSEGIIYHISANHGFLAGTTVGAGTVKYLFRGHHSATAGNMTSGTESFTVWSNGNVVNTNNSYGGISDVKLKENIVDASSQWNDIKNIRVRKYNFIKGQTHTQLGVVAQEVETVSPGLVSETPDTDNEDKDLGTVTKSVNYSVLYMKAVKALQEAMTRIETLETQNASFEARLTALEGGAS